MLNEQRMDQYTELKNDYILQIRFRLAMRYRIYIYITHACY